MRGCFAGSTRTLLWFVLAEGCAAPQGVGASSDGTTAVDASSAGSLDASTGLTTAAVPATTTSSSSGATDDTSTGASPVCAGDPHTPGGPDRWDGCWPGPDNTGVPADVTLTPYDGPCTITEDGTVIDAKEVACSLVIQAADVRITRSLVHGTVATDEDSTVFSFEITDSEVDAGENAGTGVGAVNFVARRVHVHGGNRSMHCWHDCTIEDCYVHGQFEDGSGTAHESGIRMGQSAVIRHSTIICDAPDVPPDGGCSADLTGYGDFAPVRNDTIERNLFGASTGGYCTYGGSTAGKPYSDQAENIVFVGNVWQRGTHPSDHGEFVCGAYGSNTGFDPTRPGNQWDDNVFDDGTPVVSAN